MKKQNRPALRIFAFATAALLGASLLVGCQPTPDAPPVVNKAEGMTNAMFAEPLPDGQKREVDAPAHWTDSILRQDGMIELVADVDVEIPDGLGNVPITKLEQTALSDERLKTMVDYFTNGDKLYGALPMTKTELSAQLAKMEGEQGAYGEYATSGLKVYLQQKIFKLKQLIEQAPDSVEKEYLSAEDVAFGLPWPDDEERQVSDYAFDRSPQPAQSKNYFEAKVETGDQLGASILAGNYDANEGTRGKFRFTHDGDVATAWYLDYLIAGSSYYRDNPDQTTDAMKVFLTAQDFYVQNARNILDNVSDSQEEAQKIAQKALDDLQITELALSDAAKGAWLPRPIQEWDTLAVDWSAAQGGYFFTYTRSSGALAGFRDPIDGYSDLPEGSIPVYTPPFRMESIEIFVSNGKILHFDWRNMAQVTETITENSNLISLDEAAKRLADYMAYTHAIPTGAGGAPDDYKERIYVHDVQLRADYSPAKDDPSKVWLIPVWVFQTEVVSIDGDRGESSNGKWYQEISALDGSVIVSG